MSSAPRTAAAAALLLLGLGACRADSILTPAQPDESACIASVCGGFDGPAPEPDASIVIEPLEDAAERLVPYMMDDRTRAALPPVLDALRRELLAGRLAAARLQLGRAYDALDLADRRLGATDVDGAAMDLADLSAIRLSLVPAAAALGVSVP